MLNSIRALTIDLDDTLWDVAPVIRRAEEKLAEWLTSRYPRIPQRYKRADMLTLRQQVAAANPDQAHDFRFLRRAVMCEMARGVGYADTLADEAFEVFDQHRNEVEFFDDVLPALERLHPRYRLVAVTNGNADLHRIGVAHLFHGIVTAVSAGAAKPHPQIFARAMEHARSEPAEVLHVGDHPDHDIEGARRAGMLTVWVNRRGDDWPQELQPPHAEVPDFAALLQLLESA